MYSGVLNQILFGKPSLKSVSTFLLVFWLCVNLSKGQHNYEYEDEEINQLYLSPMDGIDCMVDRIPRKQSYKSIPGVCWRQFKTLVDFPSSLRMHTMDLNKYCLNQFKTISDIAREGRPKVLYRNVRIRCSGYRATNYAFAPLLDNPYRRAYMNTYRRFTENAGNLMENVRSFRTSMWPFRPQSSYMPYYNY